MRAPTRAAPGARGRLFREARGHPGQLALTLALPVAAGAVSVARAYLLALGVNGVFLEGIPPARLEAIALGLLLASGLHAALRYAGGRAAAELAIRVKTDLRTRLARALPRRPGVEPGAFAVTIRDAVEELDAFFRGYLPALAEAALVPLGVLLLVVGRDPLSALVLLLTAPLIPLFMVLIGRWSEGVTRRQWRALLALGAFFYQALKGLVVLRVLGAADATARKLRDLAERHREATLAVLRVAFLSALALELLATLSTAIVAVEVGLRLLYARMDYLTAFFVLLLAPEFYAALRNLGAQFHPAESAAEAIEAIAPFLDAPEPAPAAPCPEGAGPGLVLEGVGYVHPGGGGPKGVSFRVRPGELLALTGPSGAGKTTLLKLVLGLLPPQRGRICLNGRPVAPERFAYLPQRPFLFAGTVRENLRLADPEAPDEALRAVLAEVALDHLELDRKVGEGGAGLSAGERQRLALARALLKDPEAFLLDEPTAHLDPESERRVLEVLNRLKARGPVVAVAHRPALIAAADLRYRMEGEP